jgi:peptidoglycan/LPS O-acetylase OafA/YrhL
MNIVLWILQIPLALHTLFGAVWKVSHSEQAVPSLRAIPHVVWLALIGVELLCAAGLILPLFDKRRTPVAVAAAGCIAVEMVLFACLHLGSGVAGHGELVYWLVVAAIAAFVARGRSARAGR